MKLLTALMIPTVYFPRKSTINLRKETKEVKKRCLINNIEFWLKALLQHSMSLLALYNIQALYEYAWLEPI